MAIRKCVATKSPVRIPISGAINNVGRNINIGITKVDNKTMMTIAAR